MGYYFYRKYVSYYYIAAPDTTGAALTFRKGEDAD